MQNISITKFQRSKDLEKPVYGDAFVLSRLELPGQHWRLEIRDSLISQLCKPGQFVMLSNSDSTGKGILLPRPMAIHRANPERGTFEVIFKVVGFGTEYLSTIEIGQAIYVLGPLGNGFEIPEFAKELLLIGRGIGICSIAPVAQEGNSRGITTTALLSSRIGKECVGIKDFEEFKSLVFQVSDDDYSSDVDNVEKQLLSRYSISKPDAIMICGSNRLMRMAVTLGHNWNIPVQVSMEAHMACGLGYCHSCPLGPSPSRQEESPLVCVDGPVFEASF